MPHETGAAASLSKRQRFARLCCASGLNRLLEWAPRRRGLLVLNYHRVGNPENCAYDQRVFSATPEMFDEQITYLKRRFSITTLEEAEEFCRRPERLKQFHVLITFDDGYVDNYDTAYPILRSHAAQGTFFVPTAFVATDQIPWWDQISYILRNTNKNAITLSYPVSRTFDLTNGNKEVAFRPILRLYKAPETDDSERFLSELENACEVSRPRNAAPPLFMNWIQANEMARNGMAIGSHTHRHRILSKLTYEAQYQELRVSRDLICQHLQVTPSALAFPVGSKASFSEATVRALKEAGYKMAFSFYGGVNTPRNLQRFNILRQWVEMDTTLPVLRLRVTGAALTASGVY